VVGVFGVFKIKFKFSDHTGSVFGITKLFQSHYQLPLHIYFPSGVFNAFSAVTGFIGVYVAGWILHSSNNHWSYVFIFTAFQCLLGALVYGTMGTGNKII
jgi:hypothetical protein